MKRLGLIAVLALMMAVPGWAGTIFDNGPPLVVPAPYSDFDFPQQVADDFSLSPGLNTIRDVHWWGRYATTNTVTEPDDWTIRIFADAGGVPNTNHLHQFALGDVGRTVFSGQVYEFSAGIPDTTLAANTTFWLSIVNDTAADTDDNFVWSLSQNSGNSAFRVSDGNVWSAVGSEFEMAFLLTDDPAIPEPSTYLLFGLGALGVMVWRRRQRGA